MSADGTLNCEDRLNRRNRHGPRNGDFWAGVFSIAVGIVGWASSSRIFVPAGISDGVGPRAFPVGASVLVIVVGLALALRALRRGDDYAIDFGSSTALVVFVAAMALYLLLLPMIGFLTSTTLLAGVLFRYLGERRWWVVGVAAVLFSAAVTEVFSSALNVSLPLGPLGF